MKEDYANVINADGTVNRKMLDWTPLKSGFLEGLIYTLGMENDEKHSKKVTKWYDSELAKGMKRLEYIPKTGRTVHIGIEIPYKEERKRLINSAKSRQDRWKKVLEIFDKTEEKYPKDTYHWPNSCVDANVFFENNCLSPGDTAILYGGSRPWCLEMLADDLIVKGVNVAYSMEGSI